MLETNLPSSMEVYEMDAAQSPSPVVVSWETEDWVLAGWVVSHNRTRCVVHGFNAINHQVVMEVIISPMTKTFTACIPHQIYPIILESIQGYLHT